MPYREDLEAALAHLESTEEELALAREASTADHERIAALEEQLAKAKRGISPKGGSGPAKAARDEPKTVAAAPPGMTLGAVLGRIQLRHGTLLTLLSALLTAAGASLVLLSLLVWGFEPARRHGHDAFLCGPNCFASLGGQMTPFGVLLFVVALGLTYYFKKPTRRRVERGKIQGGFAWRDLRDLDIGGLALIQCEFNASDLRGASLEGSTFGQCGFEGSNLRGAKLDGATFRQCEFGRCDLRSASLEGATFSQCQFGGAELDDAKFGRTRFEQCHLVGTAVARAKGELDGVTLEQCEIQE